MTGATLADPGLAWAASHWSRGPPGGPQHRVAEPPYPSPCIGSPAFPIRTDRFDVLLGRGCDPDPACGGSGGPSRARCEPGGPQAARGVLDVASSTGDADDPGAGPPRRRGGTTAAGRRPGRADEAGQSSAASRATGVSCVDTCTTCSKPIPDGAPVVFARDAAGTGRILHLHCRAEHLRRQPMEIDVASASGRRRGAESPARPLDLIDHARDLGERARKLVDYDQAPPPEPATPG
jgi:hypothetical protein